ncbi:hypothetical protein PoB_004657200 [Plakobranchus ocellatus]|uniref:Uncharacterized protein n=1 Tax=Plakobranchus ocellatus TaxID=259542 RepID=A0AAV4BL05_9GAST|nr:hypothetical protein PoB_004657200 [Plakobranchus ocellatus]
MTFHFILTGLAIAAVYASLVHQTEAGWQDRFNVNDVIKKNPGVQKLLDGPLGFIINTIVDIVLLLVDTILGGTFVPINRFKKLENEVHGLEAILNGNGMKTPF